MREMRNGFSNKNYHKGGHKWCEKVVNPDFWGE